MATISGWGLIDPTVRIPPNDLHIVDVPIVSDEDCAAAFGDASLVTPQTICVGLGGVGACSVSQKLFFYFDSMIKINFSLSNGFMKFNNILV